MSNEHLLQSIKTDRIISVEYGLRHTAHKRFLAFVFLHDFSVRLKCSSDRTLSNLFVKYILLLNSRRNRFRSDTFWRKQKPQDFFWAQCNKLSTLLIPHVASLIKLVRHLFIILDYRAVQTYCVIANRVILRHKINKGAFALVY